MACRADMDMNGHINNVNYLAWALETVPSPVYDNHHLYQVGGGRWGAGVGGGGGGGGACGDDQHQVGRPFLSHACLSCEWWVVG